MCHLCLIVGAKLYAARAIKTSDEDLNRLVSVHTANVYISICNLFASAAILPEQQCLQNCSDNGCMDSYMKFKNYGTF